MGMGGGREGDGEVGGARGERRSEGGEGEGTREGVVKEVALPQT
jgi:hypothetical protein